jgi:hypothetical protein
VHLHWSEDQEAAFARFIEPNQLKSDKDPASVSVKGSLAKK